MALEPEDKSKPGAASSDECLDDQIDRLLGEVEALTDEVLTDSDPSVGIAPAAEAGGSGGDPARAPVADDVGLSKASPLIQDGERVPPEDVVADVDQELSRMEQLISGMSATSDSAAPSRDSGSSPGFPAGRPATVDEDIAGAIPSEPLPAAPPSFEVVSEQERQLDRDLDALLAEVPDLPPPPPSAADGAGAPRQSESAPKVAVADSPAPRAADDPRQPEDLLDSVSIWRLLRVRSAARSRRLIGSARQFGGRRLVQILDWFDDRLGCRVPPMVKELIGYCALGTLAMCLVALAISWL